MCFSLPLQLWPLTNLHSLQQLDVACNQVSSFTPLSSLTTITQLSCESNSIASLAGVDRLTGLVELYAAHNSLPDIQVGLICMRCVKG